MNNFDWCVYTYRHRIAFRYVTEKLIKDESLRAAVLNRAKVHDMDKMLMYLFMDQYESQSVHVRNKPHHQECSAQKSYLDLVENVIDYECAPYTKPDKPLNAFDFTNKLLSMDLINKETAESLIKIMHEFGIDSSYDITKNPEAMEFVNSMPEITEEMILLEVMTYINENPDNELNWIINRNDMVNGR